MSIARDPINVEPRRHQRRALNRIARRDPWATPRTPVVPYKPVNRAKARREQRKRFHAVARHVAEGLQSQFSSAGLTSGGIGSLADIAHIATEPSVPTPPQIDIPSTGVGLLDALTGADKPEALKPKLPKKVSPLDIAAAASPAAGGKVLEGLPKVVRALGYAARRPIRTSAAATVAADPAHPERALEGQGNLATILGTASGAVSKAVPGVAGNALADLISLPAQVPPSLYLTGAALLEKAQGRPDRLNQLWNTYKEHDFLPALLSGHLGEAASRAGEHPLYAGLEVSGLRALGGAAAGRALRTPKGEERPPTHLYGGVKQGEGALAPVAGSMRRIRGTYSRDPMVRAAQTWLDARRLQARPGPNVVGARGQTIRSIQATPRQAQQTIRQATIAELAAHRGLQVGTRDEISAVMEAVKPARHSRDIVQLMAQRALRNPETAIEDLRHFRTQLEASRPNLDSRAKLDANAESIRTVDAALKNPDVEGIARATDAFMRVQAPLERGMIQRGLLAEEQARRAPLFNFARTHMGARHGLTDEDAAAVRALESQRKQEGGPGLALEQVHELNRLRGPSNQELISAEGKPLATAEIEAEMARRGVPTEGGEPPAPYVGSAKTPLAGIAEEVARGPVKGSSNPFETPSTLEEAIPHLRSAKGKPGVTVEDGYARAFDMTIPGVKHVVYRDKGGNPRGILTVIFEGPKGGAISHSEIVVDPAFRRQGIATKLLQGAIDAGLPMRVGPEDVFTREGAALRNAAVEVGRQENVRRLKGLSDIRLRQAPTKRGKPQVGYVSGVPGGADRPGSYWRNFGERPNLSRKTLTGEAAASGTAALTWENLVGTLQRQATTLGAVKTFDRIGNLMGLGIRDAKGVVRPFSDPATARAAIENPADYGLDLPEIRGGYGVWQVGHMTSLARELESARREGPSHGIAEALDPELEQQGLMEAAVERASAAAAPKGKTYIMPNETIQLLKHSFATTTPIEKALQAGTGWLKSAWLPTSPGWMAGNIIDNFVVRTAGTGLGPGDIATGRRLGGIIKAEHGDEAARATEMMTPGGFFGSTPKNQPRRLAEAFEGDRILGDVAKAGATLARVPGPKQALGAFRRYSKGVFNFERKYVEQMPQYAELSRASRKMIGMTRGEWRRAVKAQDPAIADFVNNGLRDTAYQRFFGERVAATYGNWVRMSPAQRRFLSLLAPFWTWARAATKFVFLTMPREHPIITGLLASAEQMTSDERKRFGLDFNAEVPMPGYLQGSLPVGGQTLKISNLSSYGFFANFPENYAASVFPQGENVVQNLKGLQWNGRQLVDSEGKPARPWQRVLTATLTAGSSFVPFFNVGQSVAKDGPIGALPAKSYPPELTNFLRNLQNMQQIGVSIKGVPQLPDPSAAPTGDPWGDNTTEAQDPWATSSSGSSSTTDPWSP